MSGHFMWLQSYDCFVIRVYKKVALDSKVWDSDLIEFSECGKVGVSNWITRLSYYIRF